MHVAIIGNGISGITAARFLRKFGIDRITVISSESDFFWSRTALMYIYMGHMRLRETQPYEDWFWEKNKIDLVRGHVTKIHFNDKQILINQITDSAIKTLSYDKLIIAVGSSPNKFGWPGQDLDGVSGMYSLQDLEHINQFTEGINRAVIVGGGLIGIELAEMLHSRNIPVSFLVRESSFWNKVLPPEESAMVNREIQHHDIDLRLSTELDEIVGDDHGRCREVRTDTGDLISCQFVGLTAGVHPNIDWLKPSNLTTDRGILVNEYLETNIPDVYAIGDCAQIQNPSEGRRSIEAVWYTGKMMGETVAYNIAGQPVAYEPGIWFNSAKFFNIEYQVYGHIPAELSPNMDTLYWENSEGNKSIRINYQKHDHHVLGFNLMGIRYRQEVCEKWIQDGARIETVLEQLKLANFDPEFYKTSEHYLLDLYQAKTGKKVNLKHKRQWSSVRKFLKTR